MKTVYKLLLFPFFKKRKLKVLGWNIFSVFKIYYKRLFHKVGGRIFQEFVLAAVAV